MLNKNNQKHDHWLQFLSSKQTKMWLWQKFCLRLHCRAYGTPQAALPGLHSWINGRENSSAWIQRQKNRNKVVVVKLWVSTCWSVIQDAAWKSLVAQSRVPRR